MEEWRKRVLGRMDTALIALELVLSVIFIALAYLTSNMYFRGVGVGLVIAWVTSAIAYLYKKRNLK